MPAFFTARGDDGTTSLPGGRRVSKDDEVIETLGALDEANAAFGLARSLVQSTGAADLIRHIQRDLQSLMGEVAMAGGGDNGAAIIQIDYVNWLEEQVAFFADMTPPFHGFILPGDLPGAAALDLARTAVRKAERRVIHLYRNGILTNAVLLAYLNRLSSLCFVLEQYEAKPQQSEKNSL
jgi:cob(I)alamin adenosyltransferase